jgi:hypothetical protein
MSDEFECRILTLHASGRKMHCHAPIAAQARGFFAPCNECIPAGRCLLPELPGATYVDLEEGR